MGWLALLKSSSSISLSLDWPNQDRRASNACSLPQLACGKAMGESRLGLEE